MTFRKISKDNGSSVGLIGVGTMGRGILKKLVESGFKTIACDPFPQARKFAEDNGALIKNSPQEVAASADLIVMSLPGPKQIEEVVLGEKGLLSSLQAGQIVVDTSTVDPGTTQKMEAEVCKVGAAYLDAPILGRPAFAGKWLLPIGGNSEALKSCRPALETFAARTVPVGPSGAGNTLKLLNQLMFSTINAISAEVLAIAGKAGIEPKVVYETIATSGAATVSGLFCEVGKKIVEREFDPLFTVDLLIKDAGLGIEMAKSIGAPPVIAQIVQTFNEIASAKGLGKEDTSALIKVYEDLLR